jgi:ATP-binding cassette subfamily B (MDR/TAP) protein 1
VTIPINNRNTGKAYTSGDIMACFLGVVYGIFALGMSTPNFKAISEGKIAGKMAYDIIERKSAIPIDDPNGKKLDDLKGRIEFKNVSFTYPTR